MYCAGAKSIDFLVCLKIACRFYMPEVFQYQYQYQYNDSISGTSISLWC